MPGRTGTGTPFLTELRHDTILYAKQSYTIVETVMPMPPEETGWICEPVPDFYARLFALTKMTNQLTKWVSLTRFKI